MTTSSSIVAGLGRDPDPVRWRAHLAELLAEYQLGGRLVSRLPFQDATWRGPDLELPDGRFVDVKSVPSPRPAFVAGGNARPDVVALVVHVPSGPILRLPGRDPYADVGVLGFVAPGSWTLGPTPAVFGSTPRTTWHVLADQVVPWRPARAVDADAWARALLEVGPCP